MERKIMRKNFGAKAILYPMSVLIIGTYDENGKANAMNAAWGGISEETQISICVDDGYKTAIANGGVFRKNDINDALILSKVKEGDIMLSFDSKIRKHMEKYKEDQREYQKSIAFINELQKRNQI